MCVYYKYITLSLNIIVTHIQKTYYHHTKLIIRVYCAQTKRAAEELADLLPAHAQAQATRQYLGPDLKTSQ